MVGHTGCLNLLCALAGLIPGPACAADIGTPRAPAPLVADAGWRFQLTGYGWATGLNGDIGVRSLPPVKVDEDFAEIFDHLNGAFMGSLFARNDRWIVGLDLVWAKLSDDATADPGGRRHPSLAAITPGTQVKFNVKQAIASGLVGYKLPGFVPDLDLFVAAGVRYQRLTVDIKLLPGLLPLTSNKSGLQDWADPVVGFVARYKFGDHWFLHAIADVGGFGVGSQFTTQGFATIGYMWTPNLSTSFGYRIIYTDYRSNTFRYEVAEQGLFVGLGYHF